MEKNEKKSFIYGLRATTEALESGHSIDKVLIKKGLKGALFQKLFSRIREYGIPFQFVPSSKLDNISRKNHQGVIAFLSPVDFYRVEEVLPGLYERGKNPFLLLLDGLTDVRNFGAILRTAECAGVHAVVIPQKNFARISEDTAKTSAGALYRIPVCRSDNLEDVVEYLKKSGVQVVGVTEKAGSLYHEMDLQKPSALVMGAEDKGISPGLLQKMHFLACIPLSGKIESLNVSVAAGIILYEVVRQRSL
jgi:23S rRNA (guanosine2251-2'-O)-methyltransferase